MKNIITNKLSTYFEFFLNNSFIRTLFFILICFLPFGFLWNTLEGRDASVYMYAGKLIKNGNLPYINYWDHKTPVIYFYYSLQYFFTDNIKHISLLFLSFFLFVSIVQFYKLIRLSYNNKITFFVILLYLSLYFWLIGKEGAFLIENYIFFLQILTLSLFFKNKSKITFFTISFLISFTILLKPTLVSISISIYFLFFLNNKNFKILIKNIIFSLIGFIIPILIVIILYKKNNGLMQLYDQVVSYNKAYISSKFIFLDFIKGFENIFYLVFISLTSWILILFLLIKDRYKIFENTLTSVAFFSFPIEIYFTALSGNFYPHYYFSFILINVLLIAFLLDYIEYHHFSLTYFLVPIIFILFISIISYNQLYRRQKIYNNNVNNEKLVMYLNNLNTSNPYCVILGNEVWIYLNTKYKPIDKYAYQYSLFKDGYTKNYMWNNFITNFKQIKPSVYINTDNPVTKLLPTGLNKNYLSELDSIINFNYRIDKRFGNYTVYLLK